MKKSLCYVGFGICLGVLYKTYEEKICCICKKMMKKDLNVIENGLDIN